MLLLAVLTAFELLCAVSVVTLLMGNASGLPHIAAIVATGRGAV
jgi:hypothetical protein